MAKKRRKAALGGSVFLDAEGLSKAAQSNARVQAILVSARNRDARVVTSALTLAEVLRGQSRDAAVYRVLRRIPQLPVTAELGRKAGELIGATRLKDHTVDAVAAATALDQPGPVLLVTSDAEDMVLLTASRKDLSVVAV